MKALGKKTTKKVASPQPQRRRKVSAHWHPPIIYYPRQTRFCQTKEEFHEEYGLSLEGADPRYLGDIHEDQWLSVFTQKHLNNEKIHLKLVRPEFREDCALLYHKVYQTIPPNYEITIKFARGFAFERCTLARSPTKMAKYKVAWAVFAESVISNVTMRKKLSTKMALWKAKNGVSTILPPSLPRQDSFEASPGGRPSSSEHPSSQHDVDHLMQTACSEHVEIASDVLTVAKGKLRQKQKLVFDCVAALDEAKTRRDKAKGVCSAADALKEKINRAKEELQGVEGESNEALVWRLKAEIMGCKVALDLLGPDVSISTLDKDVRELEELHKCLLKELEDANAQACFVKELMKVVEKRQVPSLAIAPPAACVGDKGTLVIGN
ncbi:hypothetical protein GOP47_0017568 [Adiantum capillus-veneris]|uniref:Uncharacterized protein n=1 Tax=Adiantum capillus-veneris TaxID=13818 RepID=A0A9D4UFP5_ADICA|nr:hypothetical protein GOP47_0017568 [Adiantum capillus-veneris]